MYDGGICLSPAFSIEKVKLFVIFSLEEKNLPFGGINLPLREKTMFIKEYSLNLPASLSLGAMNLPHGRVGLFSLGGMNSSSREFILPFKESFLSLENRC